MKRKANGQFQKKSRTTRSHRAHEKRARPRKRSAHRSTARAAAPAPRRTTRRRNSSGHRSTRARARSTRRQPVNVAIVQPSMGRERSTRRHHRSSRPRRMREPPILRGRGLTLLSVGGIIGATAADMLSRYISGYSPAQYAAAGATQPTYPTPQSGASSISDVNTYNDYAQAARPNMYAAGAQVLLSLAGFGLGALFKAPSLKVLLYGFGAGAAFHLATQLLNAYVLEPLFSKTDAGARMYQHEWNASGRMGAGTMAGPPAVSQMGRPAETPALAPASRVPTALASLRAAMPANPFAGAQPDQMGAIMPRGTTLPAPLAGVRAPVAVTQPAGGPSPVAPPGNGNGGGSGPSPMPVPITPAPGGGRGYSGTTTPQGGVSGVTGSCGGGCGGGCGNPSCGGSLGQPPAPAPQSDDAWMHNAMWRRHMGQRRAAA